MILFSVIVPVYNVENYLSACIDSIVCQNFTNFEVILVDDGSTDKSPFICDKYAKKDDRIHVIHKGNGGSTSARKAAANIAKGKYIICIDSDDYIEQGYFLYISKILKQYDADIITFHCCKNAKKENFSDSDQFFYTGTKYNVFRDSFLFDLSSKDLFYKRIIPFPLWCKIIKKDIFVKSQNMVDNKIVYGEDALCSLICLHFAKSLLVSNKEFYNYRQVSTSMMNKRNNDKIKCYRDLYDEMIKLNYIDKNQIYLESLCDMWNLLGKYACESNSCFEFKSFFKKNSNYEYILEFAKKAKTKKINLKSKIKVFLIQHEIFSLIYIYYKFLKIKKNKR